MAAKGAKRTTTKRKPEPGRQSARTPSPPARRSRTTARRAPAARAELPPDLVEHFGVEVVELARQRAPEDASDADLARLLAEARRLAADPFRGDVYLARGYARDGAAAGYDVVARRDALLRFAELQPAFRGFDCDAIYAEDEFHRSAPDAGGGTLRERGGVQHFAGHPKDRGDLVAAWCLVEVAERPPVYFLATVVEYLPPEDVADMDPGDPRRRYPDRYLVKAAMCWPLRMAFGLNDVVGAEELRDLPARRRAEPTPDATDPLAAPVDDLDRRVLTAYHEAARRIPTRWPAAKVRARLLGDRSDEERARLAADIAADVLDAVETRAEEVRSFDASTLDEDDAREHERELERAEESVREARVALGLDAVPA